MKRAASSVERTARFFGPHANCSGHDLCEHSASDFVVCLATLQHAVAHALAFILRAQEYIERIELQRIIVYTCHTYSCVLSRFCNTICVEACRFTILLPSSISGISACCARASSTCLLFCVVLMLSSPLCNQERSGKHQNKETLGSRLWSTA